MQLILRYIFNQDFLKIKKPNKIFFSAQVQAGEGGVQAAPS